MQKYKRAKDLLAGTFGILYFYRAKARERGPPGASVHGEGRPIYKEEEISMPVEVKVTLDVESMSEFMIYHIYTSRVGAFLLALGALNVGLAVAFALHSEAMLTLVFAVFAGCRLL